MSATRQAVLRALRAGLTAAAGRQGPEALRRRLDAHAAGPVPARGAGSPAQQINLFVAEAERVDATTVRVANADAVPGALAAFLADHNLAPRLRAAPHPLLRAIPFAAQPALEIIEGAATGADAAGLSVPFCAVAETGSLVFLSGPESPVTVNFLPDNHIVVLPTERLVGSFEQAWQRIRGHAPEGAGLLPRAVNFITGPSRSADIEQTLLLGAHGPRRLHIVVVEGGLDHGARPQTG